MKRLVAIVGVLFVAGLTQAAEIGGKFAFGFEQGIGISDSTGARLGQGVSFKLCLTNNIAVKAALGFNMSNKIDPVMDEKNILTKPVYQEDKARIDYTAAAYGIIVFRRFERVHLNGMTGLLVAFRDNHFKTIDNGNQEYFKSSGESFKTMDFHLRVLMAPEIFLFPNFSLEYKYGFDVAIKKESVVYSPNTLPTESSRLYIDIIGDLNLLQSASVHFYF